MRQQHFDANRHPWRAAGLVAVAASLGLAAASVLAGPRQATVADIPAACGTYHPFFVTTRFPVLLSGGAAAGASNEPAVVAFRDGDGAGGGGGAGQQITLATHAQVGSVYGLAYDPVRQVLYAAAYHKRGAPFGPGGPGAIYRIDVAAGSVAVLASLAAGPDYHDLRQDEDRKAAAWVGLTSLGDLALDDSGDTLFVTNLHDRQVYRLDASSGQVLGSFPNGGLGQSWSGHARPFALGWQNGQLYHGVINAAEPPLGYLYRSAPDGGGLVEVAAFDMNYGRRPPWFGWEAGVPTGSKGQPMFSDVVFRSDGSLVVGLRDRRVDQSIYVDGPSIVAGGDLLPGFPFGDTWRIIGLPELYQDDTEAEETAWGGLARFPGLDLVVASAAEAAAVPGGRATRGGLARWFDNRNGVSLRSARLYSSGGGGRNAVYLHGLGDVEALCDAAAAYPELSGTATSAAGTAIATATIAARQTISLTLTAQATRAAETATAAAATGTAAAPATATAIRVNHERMTGACGTENPFFFTTVFGRELVTGRIADEPAVVGFHDTPNDDLARHVVLATQGQVGATYGLAYHRGHEQIYVAAYMKRGTAFGPGGPGAIYRIDVRTGEIVAWANLAAGPDWHNLADNFDAAAAPWAGKSSLGDIELSEDGTELFVVNLWDRRIWRFAVPDGQLLGAFAIGGLDQPWAEDARPLGLGFRDGWLYHGVVNSQETIKVGARPWSHVYRSRPDGAERAEVLALDMSYNRSVAWSAWSDTFSTNQPLLADIEFRPDGEPILGFRDRRGDAQIFSIGQGETLPTRREGERWRAVADPEYYEDYIAPHDENHWGALAAFPGRDWLVTSALAPVTINSGGALWLDNATGRIQRPETVYFTFVGGVTLPTFAKSEGLGDVESLCPPSGELTPTPLPSPTPTLTPSPTATATPTATPTLRPRPIYLPVLVSEACAERVKRADVVVVIDVSTSMQRTTSAGRKKIEAAQEAVKAFIGHMKLVPDPEGFDQVAVVGFNNDWWLQHGLTNDRVALEGAVDALPLRTAEGTRLDLAVTGGLAALAGPERNPENTPVMVLLTDGLPNRVPTPSPAGSQEDTVLAVATRAKAAGVRLYTIGLGQPTDIDAGLLSAMASAPDMFYYAPDGEALAEIYAQIAYTIGCPGGRHDWGQPWP